MEQKVMQFKDGSYITMETVFVLHRKGRVSEKIRGIYELFRKVGDNIINIIANEEIEKQEQKETEYGKGD